MNTFTNLPALPDASHLGSRRRTLNEDSASGLGFPQPPRIARLGGRFYFVGENGEHVPAATFDPKLGSYVDVVVVDVNAKKSKLYYDKNKPYDPNSTDPPLCFSDNGVAPSFNAIQPQSQLCNNCPQNVRGSAIGLEGKLVTACKDSKKLAVLAAGQPGTWLFTVPAASLGNYRTYVDWVSKQALPGAGRNADIADTITRVFFKAGEPNIVEFSCVGIITAEIAAMQDKLLESGQTDAIVGRADQPRQELLPLPAPNRQPTGVLEGPQAVQPPPPPQPRPDGFQTASGPVPFSVPGMSVRGAAVPAAIAPPQQAANGASPSNPAPRKRRTKAEMEAARNPNPQQTHLPPLPQGRQAPDPGTLPAFLDRAQNPVAPPPPEPGLRTDMHPSPQFGIAQPAAPSADLAAAVADAFKLA